MKFEFPIYINLVGDKFYQQFDGSPGGSGLAVFGAEIKASVPLTFHSEGYGLLEALCRSQILPPDNQGLLDGNTVLTPNEHKKDLVQFHGGISIFF